MTPGAAARAAVRRTGAALLLALPACVTSYEEAPLGGDDLVPPAFAVGQSIPFGAEPTTPEERVRHELYTSVLGRLQDAAKSGDVVQIEALLGAYQRGALPAWYEARLEGYRAMAMGMRFLQHARDFGRLTLLARDGSRPDGEVAPPPLGEPLAFEFSIPAPRNPVVLGGRMDDDPCGFSVALVVEDTFVDGSSRRYSNQDFVWVPTRRTLAGGETVTLPVRIDLPAVGAVQRNVNVRIDVLPGYVEIAGVRAPIARSTLAGASLTQWPAERLEVLADPLASLRQGLQLGGVAGCRTAYLAALAASGEQRQAALALLIEQVRVGRGDQELLAMAALRRMTDADILVGDRDGWLAWWQARQ